MDTCSYFVSFMDIDIMRLSSFVALCVCLTISSPMEENPPFLLMVAPAYSKRPVESVRELFWIPPVFVSLEPDQETCRVGQRPL